MNDHDGEILSRSRSRSSSWCCLGRWRNGDATAPDRRGVGWAATFVTCAARYWSDSRSWTPMARQKLRAEELGAVQIMPPERQVPGSRSLV